MISVIIPAYNEEKSLPNLVTHILTITSNREIEIIISDGGSSDRTVELVSELGVLVVKSPKKGRASQMNYGATIAKGDVLYFLHADTKPPDTFIDDIIGSIKNGYQSGCFQLAFDRNHPLLNFYAWFTKFDIDYFRFGDQSLYIKREFFEKLHGFDENLIVMEDQVFVKKIKKAANFEILKGEVTTSSRKYVQVGIIKLQLIFSVILILFYFGVSQKSLVKFYQRAIN